MRVALVSFALVVSHCTWSVVGSDSDEAEAATSSSSSASSTTLTAADPQWPADSCAEWSIVDQPALADSASAPFVATSTRIYRLSHHIQVFDRSAGWGRARLVRSVRPPDYIGAASFDAVVVDQGAAGLTVWTTHGYVTVMQRLVLPEEDTTPITAMTVVGKGSAFPSAIGRPGEAVKLWSLKSLAFHGRHVYAPTEEGGPSTPQIVVARTESPFTTYAFEAPCKSRAVAANGGSRLFIVCYSTSADVYVVDLAKASGLPTGAHRVVGRVHTQWPPPQRAAVIGTDDQPTLYTAGHLQGLVSVSLAPGLQSSTVAVAATKDGQGVARVSYLTADGHDVYAGRQEYAVAVLRCVDVLGDGRCGRQEYVEEPQVHDGSEFERVLVHGNIAYRLGGTIRTFRRDDASTPFTFDRQFTPSGYDTTIPYQGSVEWTEGAVWLPGTAEPTAWMAASSAGRVLQLELDSVAPDGVSVSLIAGNGSTIPSIGGAPVAGAAAQLTYVSPLAVAGDEYVFFGPGLYPSVGPSAFTGVHRSSPHNVEVFPHPCNFRAIAAHAEVFYIVCFHQHQRPGIVPLMALTTDKWRPTGHWSELYRFQWRWPPAHAMAMTSGSVLWVARGWGRGLTMVTLRNRTVASISTPKIGSRDVRTVAANSDGLWVGSLSSPFEYRCLRTAPTPAPPPDTPQPTPPPPKTPQPPPILATPTPAGGPDTEVRGSSSSSGQSSWAVLRSVVVGGLVFGILVP